MYAVGGALLSLAYFDVYYIIMIATIALNSMVKKKVSSMSKKIGRKSRFSAQLKSEQV